MYISSSKQYEILNRLILLFVIVVAFLLESCNKVVVSKDDLAGYWRFEYSIKDNDTNKAYENNIYESSDPEYLRYSMQKNFTNLESFVLSEDSLYINNNGFHILYFTNIPPRYNFYKYFGNASKYKIWNDSIAFYNPIFKVWDEYKIVLLNEREMQLQTKSRKILSFYKMYPFYEVNVDTLFDEIVIYDAGIFIAIDKEGSVFVEQWSYGNGLKTYTYQLNKEELKSIKMKFAYSRLGKRKVSRELTISHNYLRYTIIKDSLILESASDFGEFYNPVIQVINEIMQLDLKSTKNAKEQQFLFGDYVVDVANKKKERIFPTEKYIIQERLKRAIKSKEIPNDFNKWPYYFEENIYSDGVLFYFADEKVLYRMDYNLLENLRLLEVFHNEE